jgi:DNA-binding response OmpR family regulator
MTMTVIPRVLVVEDDDSIRALLVAALRREPFDVDDAPDGAAALQLTAVHEYAVIVLDLMMPRVNGFDFLDGLQRTSPGARSVIFVLTAFDDSVTGKLRADRVHAIIRKPFDVPQLVAMVREVALTWVGHVKPPLEKSDAFSAADDLTPHDERPN